MDAFIALGIYLLFGALYVVIVNELFGDGQQWFMADIISAMIWPWEFTMVLLLIGAGMYASVTENYDLAEDNEYVQFVCFRINCVLWMTTVIAVGVML